MQYIRFASKTGTLKNKKKRGYWNGINNLSEMWETISDKATVCPHCNSGVSKKTLIMCEDCKKEYNISMRTCPNCG